MKDISDRRLYGIFYTFLGIFICFLFYNLFIQYGGKVWFLGLGGAVLIFKGILSFVSVSNRKKHEYYFKSNFDLDKINELNKYLNVIDKINKYSLLVYSIVVGIWMFIETDYDFYTLFIVGLYMILCWRGK